MGISYGGHWISYDFLPGWENDNSIDWSVYPQPGVDGATPRGELELGMQRIYAVRKDYAHPEAVVKAYNLYWEKLYGETGDYEYWGNDEIMDGIWWIGPFAAFHPWVNIPPYYDIQAVYAGEQGPRRADGRVAGLLQQHREQPAPGPAVGVAGDVHRSGYLAVRPHHPARGRGQPVRGQLRGRADPDHGETAGAPWRS